MESENDMLRELLSSMHGVNGVLMEMLSSFSEEKIHQHPAEGKWSAAQVAEHLHKADLLAINAMYGHVSETKRDPAAGIEKLKAFFLDLNNPLPPPAEIVPGDALVDKEELLDNLRTTKEKICESITRLDLAMTCDHDSILGGKTRLEILHLVIYHTMRHIHQLEKIKLVLGNN